MVRLSPLFNMLFVLAVLTAAVATRATEPASDPVAPATGPNPISAEALIGWGFCQGSNCDHVGGSLGISLAGFYRLTPKIAVGGEFEYQAYSASNADSMYMLDFAVAGRYYHDLGLCPLMKKPLSVFGHVALGWTNFSWEWAGESDSVSGFFIEPGAGAQWELTPRINLVLLVKLQLNMWMDDNFDSFNNFYFGLGAGYRF
ncbi:porin family protein [Myxococcota bacterium]|nr:porin family protein [Myxococcota bacterium]MBU1533754.1 porin family protein [Myxococcota bacterium]